MEGRGGGVLKTYLSELFTDPSFMGALLGAVITGLIAIYVMNRTNVNNRKQDKKKALNEFLKESRFLLYSVEGLIKHLGTYVSYQKEEEQINRIGSGPYPNPELAEVQQAKRLNETDIAEYIRKIKRVNRNAFTRDTFNIYLDILNITEGQVEFFWKRSLERDVSGVGDILEEASKELHTFKGTLEQKYEEIEKEYNSL